MRVFGLNAIGGQFFPPQSDGQKSTFLPVPGLRAGSISGRPVFGSRLLKTFCFTYGRPSTKLMALEALSGAEGRSRNQRYPSRATSMRPLIVFPSR